MLDVDSFNTFVFASARRAAKPAILPLLAICLGPGLSSYPANAVTPKGYQQTNLISNGAVDAATIDPSFTNPWGISIGPDFWINATGSGLNYVASASGSVAFKVMIPPASGSGTGSPTGTVYTGGGNIPEGAFLLKDKSSPQFLFCTADGTVSGWSSGSTATISLNNKASKDVYTDMAILTTSKNTLLLLANSGPAADVQAYGPRWVRVLPNAFKDPKLPAGYAPYGVHVFSGNVFVTYAPQPGANHEPAMGPGKGFVDEFDETGKFVKRVIPVGGKLNSPWGMAIAPTTFGEFGGDVLVGNFGDGTIAAYDAKSWVFKGWVTDENGNRISNPGLWEIVFGLGKQGTGNPNTLYFAAGLEGETGGVFGTIQPASTKVTTTATTVVSDGNPDNKGSKVTFTALVQPKAGFGEPEGHVAFMVDGKPLSTVPVDSTAHATASTSALPVGKHTVMAKYMGDANFGASTGKLTETIQVPTAATPIISPAAGSFATSTTITITDSTPKAKIYYTTNGATPTAQSTLYTRGFAVTATTTVKAVAAATGMATSPAASATFTLSVKPVTAAPSFSPAPGTFSAATSVTIADKTSGAVIYYTTDGTVPTTKSPVYSRAITVSAGTMTIQAMAVAPNDAPSSVTKGSFTISSGGSPWY